VIRVVFRLLPGLAALLWCLLAVSSSATTVQPDVAMVHLPITDGPRAGHNLGSIPERSPPPTTDDLNYTFAADSGWIGPTMRPAAATAAPGRVWRQFARIGAIDATIPRRVATCAARSSAPIADWQVAAKSVDEVEDIGHAGLRHQFPNTLKGKSQLYDDIKLGDLASRTKGMDGFLQTNGNTRYVLRNPGGVGVDRTTGLPTDVFTVIRRPDGSVVTMFPGTSPKG
jgi:hypothetical protein